MLPQSPSERVRQRLRLFIAAHPAVSFALFASAVFALVALLFWWAGRPLSPLFTFREFDSQYPYLVLSMAFGAGVGAAEIASRYRDEPFLAIISSPGRAYVAFNATISLAAFCLLARYPRLFGLDREPRDFLVMSAIAGFGAMIVLRSKLFNFRNDKGDDLAIGPDAVVSGLLSSIDRNIDRYRSFDRQSLVYEEAVKISDPAAAPIFIETFLASYQNLTPSEKDEFAEVIDGVLERQDLPDRLKLMAISFGLLKISGEKNFRSLMALLVRHQQPPPPTPTQPSANPTSQP